MTRRVPNLLAAASLLLSTAVAALWLRSYRASDRLDYQGEQKLYSALSNVGTLQVVHVDRDSRRYAVGFYHRATPVTSGETWWGGWHNPKAVKGILSFGVVRGNYFRVVVVPWWFVLGLAALPAIVRIRFARRSRERTRLGLCPACGYDLRATPDHCPECGATVSMVAVACSAACSTS